MTSMAPTPVIANTLKVGWDCPVMSSLNFQLENAVLVSLFMLNQESSRSSSQQNFNPNTPSSHKAFLKMFERIAALHDDDPRVDCCCLPRMWIGRRRFWVNLTRVVNSVVTLYGVGMILYCLWLLKKWQEGTAELPVSTFSSRPLFMLIFLAIGIALCLGTLGGYIVANCFSNGILCTYISSICCLVLLEVAVIIKIYFRMDWFAKISKYIDEHHQEFRSFVLFHLMACRIILIISLVPQVSAIIVAIILRTLGVETPSASDLDVPDFRQSFLVVPTLRMADDSKTNPSDYEVFRREITEDVS